MEEMTSEQRVVFNDLFQYVLDVEKRRATDGNGMDPEIERVLSQAASVLGVPDPTVKPVRKCCALFYGPKMTLTITEEGEALVMPQQRTFRQDYRRACGNDSPFSDEQRAWLNSELVIRALRELLPGYLPPESVKSKLPPSGGIWESISAHGLTVRRNTNTDVLDDSVISQVFVVREGYCAEFRDAIQNHSLGEEEDDAAKLSQLEIAWLNGEEVAAFIRDSLERASRVIGEVPHG